MYLDYFNDQNCGLPIFIFQKSTLISNNINYELFMYLIYNLMIFLKKYFTYICHQRNSQIG
jgi:hypothetical protein